MGIQKETLFRRLCNPLLSNSFFLFGARGTGKSTLLGQLLKPFKCLWIDLLVPAQEKRFLLNPDALLELVSGQKQDLEWVVIDEVQKIPSLLEMVHKLIEETSVKFALTGSSARKLKRGGANLLAGRAFVYHLFPMTFLELQSQFQLEKALRWGTLPKIHDFNTDDEKERFLDAYVHTYFKEEVIMEQLVRGVEHFRHFLEIAAQCNGTILNRSRIAADLGIDDKTVKTYFDILEDTLLGFYLPAYHRSVRKQQKTAPKFYLFDCGVKRALENLSGIPLGSSAEIGLAFEHLILCEAVRLNSYLNKKYRFSYLATKGGLEIDLVVERPAQQPVLIEIKSTATVQDHHIENLKRIKADYPEYQTLCLSQESFPRISDGIEILPWQDGLKELFGLFNKQGA